MSITIEYPCNVGAEIFTIIDGDEYSYVDSGTVEGLSVQDDGLWIFARYECGLTYWHRLKDMGNEFYLDQHEADKALEERMRKNDI